MAYDPQVQALLDELIASARPSSKSLPLEQGRRSFAELFASLMATAEVAAVEDRTIPGPAGELPMRIYRPALADRLPVTVYFHGGGWVFGDIETHDGACRQLARASGALVVSVDYRRPPESPFPAPLDDCYAATRWVYEHAAEIGADPARLAVAGDSSGGTLAAAMALKARDSGTPPIAFQLLLFPATAAAFSTPSYIEFADDAFLSKDEMLWYWGRYLASPDDARHPYASPLYAESLAGLPPALIITCEYDPLRDDGEQYAARLRAAGVETCVKRYAGMVHGFMLMGRKIDAAQAAFDEAGRALREALSRP